MVSIPTAELNPFEKTSIPLVGFGTAEYPFGANQNIKQYILEAIQVGYRHFDTAATYQSEVPLGEAIAEALRLGLIKSRHELFITSKLWAPDCHSHLVLPALKKSLRNLQLEYLDLYLIHFPGSLKPGTQYPFKKEDIVAFDLESVWDAMEECHNLNLTKSIGVSNFTCKKLVKLLSTSKIPPDVNQVEMNPFWQQKKLRKFCDENGIHVTAYSPLGAEGSPFRMGVLDSDVLKEIANDKGKTVAQVCLRWVYEQGVSFVVKSFNKERMKENVGIFDWKLSEEDLHKIDQITQKRGVLAEQFVSDEGPYKSIIELWDGEI